MANRDEILKVLKNKKEDKTPLDFSSIFGKGETSDTAAKMAKYFAPMFAENAEEGDYRPVNLMEKNPLDASTRVLKGVGEVADIPASAVRKEIYKTLTGKDKDEASSGDIVGALETKLGAPVPTMPGATITGKDILSGVTQVVTDPLMYSGFAAKSPEFLKGLGEAGELNLATKRKIGKLKNPTAQELVKNLEIGPITTGKDLDQARAKLSDLLDFSAKERMGIGSTKSKEEAMEKAIDTFYPEIKEQNIPVEINPKHYNIGSFRSKKGILQPAIVSPERIIMREPHIGVLAHEGEHLRDVGVNPFFRSSEDLVPTFQDDDFIEFMGRQKTGYLAKKLKTINPELTDKEAVDIISDLLEKSNASKESIKDYGKRIADVTGDRLYDFTTGGHFYQYPTNFEARKAAEMLNRDREIAVPDLKENYKIIKDVYNKAVRNEYKNPFSDVTDEYIKRNFPNINEILSK